MSSFQEKQEAIAGDRLYQSCPLLVAGVPILLRSQIPFILPDYFRPFLLSHTMNLQNPLVVEVSGNPKIKHISFAPSLAGTEESCRPYFALRIPAQEYEAFLSHGKWLNSLHFDEMLLVYRRIFLHASVVVFNEEAYVFSAPCGGGKSTQARLWERYAGADILNGDKALLEVRENARVQEHGMINRGSANHGKPEIQVFAHGSPVAGSSGIYRNESAPVRGIFFLEKQEEKLDKKRNVLEKLSCHQSFLALYGEAVKFDTQDQNEKLIDILMDIASAAECYRYKCCADEQAVWDLLDEMKTRQECAQKLSAYLPE